MTHDADASDAALPRRALVLRLTDNIEEVVSGTALVVVVLSASWGVFTRYLTRQPATWTGELATIAFAWVVFIAASACFKRGGHVSIDMLVGFLPRRLAAPIQAAIDLVVFVFCVCVALLAAQVSVQNWDNPTSVLRLPMSTTYIAVTLGFAMMALRHAQVACRRWAGRPAMGA